jgi:NADPH-dependent 2,4-dienoyl-CoA reductase/sulfur reductase-like enzyme
MVKRLKRIIAEYVDTSQFPINATVREDGVVILEGEAPDWKTADELAHRVAKSKKVRNVINHLSCDGKSLAYIPKIELIDQGRALGMLDEADVIIVGAGVIGSGIARELSKYNLDIVVLEKGDDVSQGASKANNGMIHNILNPAKHLIRRYNRNFIRYHLNRSNPSEMQVGNFVNFGRSCRAINVHIHSKKYFFG